MTPTGATSSTPQLATLIRPVVAGVLAMGTAMGIGRFAYTPILPSMERSAHLTTAQAGVLASVNYAGYLIGALLVSALPRGPLHRRVVIGCLGAIVVTTGLMAQTSDLVAWAAIRLISGMASAGVFVLVAGMVLNFLRRQGRIGLAGWIYCGVGAGIATSGVVVRVVDAGVGWRGDWVCLAAIAALAATVSTFWLPSTPAGVPGEDPATGPVRLSSAWAALLLVVSAYFLEGAGYIVTGTFLVAIVDHMRGLGDAGPTMWIVAGLSAMPSAVLWLRLAARLGYVPALTLAYGAQAFGTLLPVIGSGIAVARPAAILFGGTFIGITALTLTLAGLLAPNRPATAIGLLTVVFGSGQVIGPSLAALLAQHSGNFRLALLLAAGMVAIGSGLMFCLNLLRSVPRTVTPSPGGSNRAAR